MSIRLYVFALELLSKIYRKFQGICTIGVLRVLNHFAPGCSLIFCLFSLFWGLIVGLSVFFILLGCFLRKLEVRAFVYPSWFVA